MPVRKCWHHIADCFVQQSSHQCSCKSYKFWHFKILQRQDFLVCGLWVFCLQGASPLINWRSEVMGPHKQPSMPFCQRADRFCYFCSSSDKPSPFKIIWSFNMFWYHHTRKSYVKVQDTLSVGERNIGCTSRTHYTRREAEPGFQEVHDWTEATRGTTGCLPGSPSAGKRVWKMASIWSFRITISYLTVQCSAMRFVQRTVIHW